MEVGPPKRQAESGRSAEQWVLMGGQEISDQRYRLDLLLEGLVVD